MPTPDALPRLTKPQIKRLVEIAQNEGEPVCLAEKQPRTTDALVAADLLQRYRWRTMQWVRPSILGVRVLAGLPGDEFDRFREMMEREDAATS